jgi:hypothetical protein
MDGQKIGMFCGIVSFAEITMFVIASITVIQITVFWWHISALMKPTKHHIIS